MELNILDNMSLLDIEETTNELNELEYMTYSKFTEYLERYVPRDLWDHHVAADRRNQYHYTMRDVSYIKFVSAIRTTKGECEWGSIEPIWGGVVSERHMCIHITPTDDGLVNLEYPKNTSLTFPILVYGNEKIPTGVLKVLEPIKDKIQIIEGCL